MASDIIIDAKQFHDFLENASKYIEWAAKESIEQASELALEKMQSNYSTSKFEPGEYMDFSKTGDDTQKEVAMSGSQAVYSEFGTGTEGGMHPHPMKHDFALNEYNSGKTIRPASDKVAAIAAIAPGTLYWTYKDDNGNIHYTQGVPAQKIVYNAGIEVKDQMPEIIEKNLRRIFE